MAQWKKLQDLAHHNQDVFGRVSEILKRCCLTTEVRHELADWIEGQNWSEHQLNGSSARVLKELIAKVEIKENDPKTEFVNKLKWGQEKAKILDVFGTKPDSFVKGMADCLEEEKLLIQSCETSEEHNRKRKCPQKTEVAQPNYEIERKVTDISEKMKAAGAEIKDLETKQEELFIAIPEIKVKLDAVSRQMETTMNGQSHEGLQKQYQDLQEQLKSRVNSHYELRKQIGTNHVVLATEVCYLLKEIWTEISIWEKDQKLEIAALAKVKEGHLEILEDMCEKGAQLLMDITQNIKTVYDIYMKRKYTNDPMVNVMQKTLQELQNDYLKEHLNKVTVVSRNVINQILKVTTGRSAQFSMAIRILGGKALGLGLNPPKVTARIYHEHKLESMMAEGAIMEDSVCKIANSEGKLVEVNRKNGICMASFNNMQLNNLRRIDRGNREELVTEQKYGVVFFMKVQVWDKEYEVKTLSLPIILTSQTSQECMAKGTLIWDAAFSKDVRVPYQCEDQVPWPRIAEILNAQFVAATGHGLTDQQLNYLARIVFKTKKPMDFSQKLLTDKELIRDKLLPRDFSFWRWFWACLNLVKDLIKTEWETGLVHGFIGKQEAEECLKDQPNGTFILRFSEQSIEQSQRAGICGFLTVAVTEINPDTGSPKVFYVKQHLTPNDLKNKGGLLNILESFEILEINSPNQKKPLLRYLYPDTTKHFSEHFKAYGKKKEDEFSEYDYTCGKQKVEIFLTRGQKEQARQLSGLSVACSLASPTHSMDVPSPASFVSIANGSPPTVSVTSPAQSDVSYQSEFSLAEDLFTVERPVAHVGPMSTDGNEAKRAAFAEVYMLPTQDSGSDLTTTITTAADTFPSDSEMAAVIAQAIPQADEQMTAESFSNLGISEPNDLRDIREFLANSAEFQQDGDAWMQHNDYDDL